MEQTAYSSSNNKRYNYEATLLDGLYEFHHDFFESLDEQELHAIKTYYLTGQDIPENIFMYCAKLVKDNPEIEKEAQVAFNKIWELAGIK